MESTLVKKVCEALAKLGNIEAIYLFGSHAEGKANQYSDVDVAVLCAPDQVLTDLERLHLQQDLSDAIGQECDLIVLNGASPILVMQVLHKGKLIYLRHAKVLHRFVMVSITQYADFKKIREEMEAATLKRRVYGRS